MTVLHQEPDRVPPWPLVLSTVTVVGTIVFSLAAVAWLTPRPRAGTRPAAIVVERPDEGPFQGQTEGERNAAADRARLSSYGWIDRGRGVVRVPIDAAVRAYLRERAATSSGATP